MSHDLRTSKGCILILLDFCATCNDEKLRLFDEKLKLFYTEIFWTSNWTWVECDVQTEERKKRFRVKPLTKFKNNINLRIIVIQYVKIQFESF